MNLVPRYGVELIEKWNAHFYRPDGIKELYPGATTALNMQAKPFLIPWAAKMAGLKIQEYLLKVGTTRKLSPDEISKIVNAGKKEHEVVKDKAADVGTRAHGWIDLFVKGKMSRKRIFEKCEEDVRIAVQNFFDWHKKSGVKFLLGDTKTASKKHRFGGSLDGLGEDRLRRPGVIDFKTSNHMSDEYCYQVGGYGQSFWETYGVKPLWGVILRFGKTESECEVKYLKSMKHGLEGLLACLDLYYLKKIQKYI